MIYIYNMVPPPDYTQLKFPAVILPPFYRKVRSRPKI